jgi:hypothetical protein
MLALIPIFVLGFWAHRFGRQSVGRPAAICLAAILALLLVATGRSDAVYRAVWSAARNLVPALVVVGVVVLSRQGETSPTPPRLRAQAMLLLSVTALCSLVQFPYDAPNYFCYIAPLVALTALALYRFMPPRAAAGGLLVAFFIAFAVLRTNFRPLQQMGFSYRAPFPMAPLQLERAGISVPDVHATVYAQLVPMLRARAHGEYTWASPDSPEIYFLSGLKNPTRALFDFLDDSSSNADFIVRALDAHGVTAIVLNSSPAFSAGITREMFARLASRFPHGQMIGPFQLRWRE